MKTAEKNEPYVSTFITYKWTKLSNFINHIYKEKIVIKITNFLSNYFACKDNCKIHQPVLGHTDSQFSSYLSFTQKSQSGYNQFKHVISVKIVDS